MGRQARQRSDKGPNLKKKGKPTSDINGMKDVHVENLHNEQEAAEKYTVGQDEEPAENIFMRHHNRNLNKPDIDKPAYS